MDGCDGDSGWLIGWMVVMVILMLTGGVFRGGG